MALTILLFFTGASFASFFAAMLARKNMRSQFTSQKRSHCDSCGRILHWYELIPVIGFFINRGRCRKCHNKIPVWYVLAEIIGGFIFIVISTGVAP